MEIDKPSIYSISMPEYHALKLPTPALSSGIAHLLCTSSPLHAWTEHPLLNPGYVREENESFDLGTIVHSLLLEGIQIAEVLEFKDWRTDKSQEARRLARTNGLVPILSKNWPAVLRMIQRIREQIGAHQDSKSAFVLGQPEQTLVWLDEEYGVWCKARLDWLTPNAKYIYDLKTTGISSNPEVVSRSLFANGLDIQAAWYIRGLLAVLGIEAQFRFVYAETFEPHALSVIGLGPDALMIGEKKCIYALEKWRDCLASDSWPGYPQRTCYAMLPEWEEKRWLEKESRDV